jgi:lysophospholipase L1-like esterase
MAEITTTQTMGNKTITTTINTAARGPKGDPGTNGQDGQDGTDANVTQANIEAAITDKPGFREEIGTVATDGTGAEAAAFREAIKSAQSEIWVVEGDSWSAGTAQGNDRETWPFYLATLAPAGVEIVNVALAGSTAQTMASTFASTVAPNLTATTGRLSTCFIFGGINDAGVPRTTTQLRDDLRTLWTDARSAGARVVAFTLPHRTAAGGWSQADWKTINAQIVADSSYWDVLVRTDIFQSNTSNGEYTDALHITTAAHRKLATEVLRAMQGAIMRPSTPPDFVANAALSVTLAASTRRNLPFTELYDANGDAAGATVGGNAGTSVFTVPVDGTYEIRGCICLSGMTAGDVCYLNAWVTPVATGVEVEHRLDYQNAGGANPTLSGVKRRRLLRGDTVSLAVVSARASSTILTNPHNGEFSVRLVSIP